MNSRGTTRLAFLSITDDDSSRSVTASQACSTHLLVWPHQVNDFESETLGLALMFGQSDRLTQSSSHGQKMHSLLLS